MKRFFWLFILLIFSMNGYANNGWERLPADSEINTALDNLKNSITIEMRNSWGDTLPRDPLIFSPVFKYHYRNYRHGYDNSLIPVVPYVEASGLIVVVRYKSILHYTEASNQGFDLIYDNNKWNFR